MSKPKKVPYWGADDPRAREGWTISFGPLLRPKPPAPAEPTKPKKRTAARDERGNPRGTR